MTATEQLALASSKVEHWRTKTERAASILHRWEKQLATLQAKAKPQPQATIDKVPMPAMTPKLVVDNKSMKSKQKPTKPKH